MKKEFNLVIILISILLLANLVQAVSVEPRNILINLSAGDETVVPINITMLERKPQSLYIETNSPYCLINGSQNATLIITQTLTIVNITITLQETEPTNETIPTPQPTNESKPTPTPPTDETSTKPSQEVPMMIIIVVASIIILAGYFIIQGIIKVLREKVRKMKREESKE